MPGCIFCKIINREISASIVYEDDKFIAFLSINPESPGHTLVITKEHFRWVWDVPYIGQYFEVVQKIAKAQIKAFKQEKILSKVVGEEVPHAHVWVFPARETPGDKFDFETNCKKINEALNK